MLRTAVRRQAREYLAAAIDLNHLGWFGGPPLPDLAASLIGVARTGRPAEARVFRGRAHHSRARRGWGHAKNIGFAAREARRLVSLALSDNLVSCMRLP
jgi:hypothetical protein